MDLLDLDVPEPLELADELALAFLERGRPDLRRNDRSLASIFQRRRPARGGALSLRHQTPGEAARGERRREEPRILVRSPAHVVERKTLA